LPVARSTAAQPALLGGGSIDHRASDGLPMLKRASYAWTAVDEAKLKLLAAKGLYLRNIAFRLRRSEYSVNQRARELGISLKPMARLRADGTIYVRSSAPPSLQRARPKPRHWLRHPTAGRNLTQPKLIRALALFRKSSGERRDFFLEHCSTSLQSRQQPLGCGRVQPASLLLRDDLSRCFSIRR
jgi:hypothetical protein